MEIKVGQVWQNDKDEKFYIKEVWKGHPAIDSKVTFISLQNTDEYFAGEVGSCSYECFMYQTRNLKLIKEDFSVSEELRLELKIKSKINKINKYKTEIKDIQNKISTIKQEIDKLYDNLKQQYPENDAFIKFQGEYITDEDIEAAGQKVLDEQKQRKEKTIENAEHWFKITCPHCKTSFECCENGYGTYYYDYLTRDGKEIVGSLDTQTLECPICNRYFKDPTLKHEEEL